MQQILCTNTMNFKSSIFEHSAPCRPRTGGKSIFYFSVFRGEIVSSSINGGCGGGDGGRKTMLKISPNWNPRHYFSSPTSAGSVGAKGRRRRRQKDDPNMAAQTEYKNARSLGAVERTNCQGGRNQRKQSAVPRRGVQGTCDGLRRWHF